MIDQNFRFLEDTLGDLDLEFSGPVPRIGEEVCIRVSYGSGRNGTYLVTNVVYTLTRDPSNRYDDLPSVLVILGPNIE